MEGTDLGQYLWPPRYISELSAGDPIVEMQAQIVRIALKDFCAQQRTYTLERNTRSQISAHVEEWLDVRPEKEATRA